MRTVVVSDLHLGSRTGRDVARDADIRARLLELLEDADRIVLLGDVVELRGLPAHAALERAGPALADIGDAAGDAEILVVPGNHDHRLLGEWIEGRRRRGDARLAVEQTARPGRSGPLARFARRLGAGEVTLAYPGVYLRPDVYATHGHYLDCHNTVPAIEALAAAATARVTRSLGGKALDADDYEATLAPMYAFVHELSQRIRDGTSPQGAGASLRIWRRLNPPDDRLTASRLVLGRVLIPGAVRGVNRAGLGPFESDLSPAAIRRAALKAMGQVADRLGIEARHVVFGHSHRAGPMPGDDDRDGWAAPGGRRLHNSGCWVYEPDFIGPSGSDHPHWPGGALVLDDDGEPRIERLLRDVPASRLEAVVDGNA
jgi:hypothetical protein